MSFRCHGKCHRQASWLSSMSFKARLCLHQGRDKSVRNVLVAGSFLRQISSTFKFSHYLLRRSHLTHKARSQCGAGWPTATPSSYPGWFVSNIHTGCPALRGSIKGLPGVVEEGHGCGCTWVADHQCAQLRVWKPPHITEDSSSVTGYGTVHTDSAGTIFPGVLAPDQFRREAQPISHSKDNLLRVSLE